MHGARSISLKDLRAECKTLETAVLANKLASLEDLAPHRPGGSANPDHGPRGHLRFYGYLHRQHAKQEHRLEVRSAPTSIDTETLVTRSVTAAPVTVVLSSVLDENGAPKQVQCYPKSRDALFILHGRDLKARALARGFKVLQELGRPEDLRVLPDVATAWGRQMQHIIWAITTSGAWLPFDPREEDPDPPEWVSLVSPEDTVRLLLGHIQANKIPLEALSQLMMGLRPDAPAEASDLLGWGAFVVSAAEGEHIAEQIVDRDRALVQLVGRAYARAKGHDRTMTRDVA